MMKPMFYTDLFFFFYLYLSVYSALPPELKKNQTKPIQATPAMFSIMPTSCLLSRRRLLWRKGLSSSALPMGCRLENWFPDLLMKTFPENSRLSTLPMMAVQVMLLLEGEEEEEMMGQFLSCCQSGAILLHLKAQVGCQCRCSARFKTD